jgi:hypothetical protein
MVLELTLFKLGKTGQGELRGDEKCIGEGEERSCEETGSKLESWHKRRALADNQFGIRQKRRAQGGEAPVGARPRGD